MNMDDLFVMGFCKAAEEHGVDPVQLAKFAETVKNEHGNFAVPTFSGSTDWLNGTNSVGYTSVGGTTYKLPHGYASLTNSPNATVQTIDAVPGKKGFLGIGKKPGTVVTNDVPVWRSFGKGKHAWNFPANQSMAEVLAQLESLNNRTNAVDGASAPMRQPK